MTISDDALIQALMRDNRESVGFIPMPTVVEVYLRPGHYIIQTSHEGAKVGYLLHGPARTGNVLHVTQNVIELDKRDKGYGREIFEALLVRAQRAQCRAIRLRCAENLPSVDYWLAMGFSITRTLHPDNKRKRGIHVMWLSLWPDLFEQALATRPGAGEGE